MKSRLHRGHKRQPSAVPNALGESKAGIRADRDWVVLKRDTRGSWQTLCTRRRSPSGRSLGSVEAPDTSPGADFRGSTYLSAIPAEARHTGFGVPVARERLVPRTALLDRLLSSNEPVITVVAPPGYGKTTFLAQWAQQLGSVAWISCERSDNSAWRRR